MASPLQTRSVGDHHVVDEDLRLACRHFDLVRLICIVAIACRDTPGQLEPNRQQSAEDDRG
jgi:hypothetical protein